MSAAGVVPGAVAELVCTVVVHGQERVVERSGDRRDAPRRRRRSGQHARRLPSGRRMRGDRGRRTPRRDAGSVPRSIRSRFASLSERRARMRAVEQRHEAVRASRAASRQRVVAGRRTRSRQGRRRRRSTTVAPTSPTLSDAPGPRGVRYAWVTTSSDQDDGRTGDDSTPTTARRGRSPVRWPRSSRRAASP